MVFLYILLGIAAFFALIFWMKVKVYIRFDDTLTLRAGYGPIVLTLAPKKPKKPVRVEDFTYEKHQKRLERERKAALKKAEKKKRRDEKKKAESEKSRKADHLHKKAADLAEEGNDAPVEDKIGFILSLVKFGLGELGRFPSYIHTDVRMLDITVAAGDAAKTAVTYGAVSAAVANLMEILRTKTAFKKRSDAQIAVRADFLADKPTFRADISFKLRVFSTVRVGWHALVWFIKYKISEARA